MIGCSERFRLADSWAKEARFDVEMPQAETA